MSDIVQAERADKPSAPVIEGIARAIAHADAPDDVRVRIARSLAVRFMESDDYPRPLVLRAMWVYAAR